MSGSKGTLRLDLEHFDISESGHRPPPLRGSGVRLDGLIYLAGMEKPQSETRGCSLGRHLLHSGS